MEYAVNDFTKEELKIIFLNLCVNEKTDGIFRKISRMISTKCEHVGLFKSGEEIYCAKCGELYSE